MASRRDFIKNTAVLSALSLAGGGLLSFSGTIKKTGSRRGRLLPKALKKGDTVGLITPGSPITKNQLDDAVKKLKNKGFNVYYEDSVLSEYGYLAGKDEERAAELNAMFANAKVDAVMCVRGGYGSIRILDKIDYELIRKNPKIITGYSDITALLNSIEQRAGLVTFHGLLGVSPFNEFSYRAFRHITLSGSLPYTFPYMREPGTEDNPEFDRYTIRPGKAEGLLAGGNISVIDSMIGSPYEPDFEEKIVFLEEIEEKTYRVDKMIYHLLYATNLKKAAGLALGVFNHCNINDKPRLSLKKALDDLLKPLGIPVAYGLSFGHFDHIITIPVGVKARLDADKKELILLEKAVR